MIYLPIAEIPVNMLLILSLGGLGGLLAGMFGIGGGFLITPLLMFIGIPPAVAVATSGNQIIASSVSGFLAHWRRNNVDMKMGAYLLLGGVIGSLIGIILFAILQMTGQIDLAISLIYVVFLGMIGTLMAIESSRTILRQKHGHAPAPHQQQGGRFGIWLRSLRLPMQTSFPRSGVELSAILPVLIGMVSGVMVALMGIGGGFVMIPAMIYLLAMPTVIVVGTSLFQIIFVTSLVTLLHAIGTESVDIVLAALLIAGGVVGAQVGTVLGLKLPAERLRILLALIVLGVCILLAVGLFLEPENLYSVTVIE